MRARHAAADPCGIGVNFAGVDPQTVKNSLKRERGMAISVTPDDGNSVGFHVIA
ncbi:hypothetical protein J2785_000835 [Burkholderia ambifaria]|nr:hypothetical protein [Burkholderia ambifaria]MDR6497692.1 hypothetical protein [Burkholderia ambifaria]